MIAGTLSGATADQITVAAERMARAVGVAWERETIESRAQWCATVERLASDLVPLDHRIISIDLLRRVSDYFDVQFLSDNDQELAQAFRDAAGLP